jgi:hypothetical protein
MGNTSAVAGYLKSLERARVEPVTQLMDSIREALPEGFEERMNYGMPSWVVPHETYPGGYHVDPSLPLPFLSVASQKRHVAVYHMGIYADVKLLAWFEAAYPKHCSTKLDMGKSCIRFKNPAKIPHALIGQLCKKMTPKKWITLYEANVKAR